PTESASNGRRRASSRSTGESQFEAAAATASGSISPPIASHPTALASATIVPDPQQGSSTRAGRPARNTTAAAAAGRSEPALSTVLTERRDQDLTRTPACRPPSAVCNTHTSSAPSSEDTSPPRERSTADLSPVL